MPTKQLSPDVCAVCGQVIVPPEDENDPRERIHKLSCYHVFHDMCIRGWCIVGEYT